MAYKSFLFLIFLASLSWAQEDIVLEGQLPETVIGLPAVRQLGLENGDWPRINTQLELNRGWNLALVTYSSAPNSAILMGLFTKQLVPTELPWQSSF